MEMSNLDGAELKRLRVFLKGELIEDAECISFDQETGRAAVIMWGGLYILGGGKIVPDPTKTQVDEVLNNLEFG